MVSDKIKNRIENIIFWASIATVVLWALAKSFGIINSPDWIEMLPYFSFAAAIATAGVKVGRTLEKIDRLEIAVIEIGKDVREIQRKAFCLNGTRCPVKR